METGTLYRAGFGRVGSEVSLTEMGEVLPGIEGERWGFSAREPAGERRAETGYCRSGNVPDHAAFLFRRPFGGRCGFGRGVFGTGGVNI